MSVTYTDTEPRFHPGVPVRCAMLRLGENADWVSIHGPKGTYEGIRIAERAGMVFGAVLVRDLDAHVFGGLNGWIEKLTVEVTILSIRSYPLGQATIFDFNLSRNAIKEAMLSKFSGMVVNDKDGNKMGEVSDIGFLDFVSYKSELGSFDTMHDGMKLRLTYR